MKKRSYQRYTAEFKEQALGLLRMGKPVPKVAAELCISTNLLYAWRSQVQLAQGGSAGLRAEGEQSGSGRPARAAAGKCAPPGGK